MELGIERQDSLPLNSSSLSWQNYDQLRLDRIRQQRQRMENMKDVIEKYTKIIRSLEQENQSLSAQFQSEQHFEKLYTDTVRENQQLSHSYSLLQQELKKEKDASISLQHLVQEQQQELFLLKGGAGEREKRFFATEEKYEQLLISYQETKNEIYLLQRENLQLKEVIRDQSHFFYQHKKGPQEQKSQKIEGKQKEEKLKEHSERKKKNIKSGIEKISILQDQIKKQEELIRRYQKTEQQHTELIEILKSRKCPCHSQATFSKKSLPSAMQLKQSPPASKANNTMNTMSFNNIKPSEVKN